MTPLTLTFADLHADAGKPCCVCLGPLDPADADRSGLAHAGCSVSDGAPCGGWFEWDEAELDEATNGKAGA